jgi:transitional endoplasmic reticulum ATPase
VHKFFGRLRESFVCRWNQANKNLSRDQDYGGKRDRQLLTSFAAYLPIAPAIIDFPRNWFLNPGALIALQLLLWWVLLNARRRSQGFLRKLIQIGVTSAIILDLILLLDYNNRHPVLGLRLGSDVFGLLIFGLIGIWWIAFFWILLSRPKRKQWVTQTIASHRTQDTTIRPEAAPELRVPRACFAEVGGTEDAKQQIREVVESRLNTQKYAAYGVNRNGILLYGPQGSGKTFLAEATAGEFGLNFHYVSPSRFITMWTGETEASIRNAFMRARANRPALLFIDEVDALGSIRQNLSGGGDPGGAGRSYNNMAIELMQSIDEARLEPGLVVMAATNVVDGLDEALIREGRFDVKIRIDLPDEATREKIFKTQLSFKPWEGFALNDFAKRIPGASAAKIRSLVDHAALFAAREGRKIAARDLQRALEEYGGRDRPLFQPVDWEGVIIEERVEQEIRSLIRLVSNPFATERMRLQVPMGVLLLGPPGTGKTMIARLIATQSKRSFLPITSAEITDPKAVSRVFSRARENSPSLIFMDEMDSLVPANPGYLNQYYVQIVEQFLIEISALQPEHNVFMVGTTNRRENIDPRILRGGRFSEKIQIGLPGRKEVARLLAKYLAGIELAPSLGLDYLTEWFTGTTPANLEAVVETAKRYAYERSGEDHLAPLSLDDFGRAASRVMGEAPPLPAARSTQV